MTAPADRAERIIAALRRERDDLAEALRQSAAGRRPGDTTSSPRSEGELAGLNRALSVAQATQ